LTEDRTTIPLSPEGARILADLVGNQWFETEVAAFQCAFALALAQGLNIERSQLRGSTTKFNVGTLDPLVRDLVVRLDPDHATKPYERATVLAEAGLRRLAGVLDESSDLAETLGISQFSHGRGPSDNDGPEAPDGADTADA
jgi:hypothetical protein